MAESQAEIGSGFVEGVTIAPEEMHARFGIEPYEIASYRDITRIYSKGEVIIMEGDQEHALYMLRVGKVEVLKGVGASRESMSTIEAVNFFGEMGMINDEPRSATVIAASVEVVVYRIPNPNIHTILTNPQWAELLILRLSKNLARSVEQHLLVSKQVKELRAELAALKAK